MKANCGDDEVVPIAPAKLLLVASWISYSALASGERRTMYCTPSDAVASARSAGTGGSAHGGGGAMTVNVPAVERIGAQPFGPTASMAQLRGPMGTETPRNCGVADVAACVAPRKRRYCVAPGTALAEKSTGETSSALALLFDPISIAVATTVPPF